MSGQDASSLRRRVSCLIDLSKSGLKAAFPLWHRVNMDIIEPEAIGSDIDPDYLLEFRKNSPADQIICETEEIFYAAITTRRNAAREDYRLGALTSSEIAISDGIW